MKRCILLIPPLLLVGALTLCLRAEPAAYRREVKLSPLLVTTSDSLGQPLAYPTGKQAQVTAVLVEIPPGTESGWHSHPVPCFAYVLEGEVDVRMPDGEIKKIVAGQAFAEVVNARHNGHNPGTQPAKLVMFALGQEGEPYAVRQSAQP